MVVLRRVGIEDLLYTSSIPSNTSIHEAARIAALSFNKYAPSRTSFVPPGSFPAPPPSTPREDIGRSTTFAWVPNDQEADRSFADGLKAQARFGFALKS